MLQADREDLVRILLETNMIPCECRDPEGNSLLVQAALRNNIDLVKELIEGGANIDATFPLTGNTILHIAAALPDPTLLTYLLDLGRPDVNVKNNSGLTPAYLCHPDHIQMLKDRGADFDICSGGEFRESRLGVAVADGDKELIKILLDAGVNPNAGTPSPLFWATAGGDVALVQDLLNHGADPFRGEPVVFIEAISKGREDIVQLFCAHNRYKDFITQSHTALTAAIAANRPALVRQFLQDGAEFEIREGYGSRQEDDEGKKMFLPGGRDFFERVFTTMKAFDDFSLVETLWEHAYKFPLSDRRELLRCIIMHKPDMVEKMIVDGKLDVNDKAFVANVIVYSIENYDKHLPLFNILIKNGCDLNRKMFFSRDDDEAKTPLEYVLAQDKIPQEVKSRLVEKLIAAGAIAEKQDQV